MEGREERDKERETDRQTRMPQSYMSLEEL